MKAMPGAIAVPDDSSLRWRYGEPFAVRPTAGDFPTLFSVSGKCRENLQLAKEQTRAVHCKILIIR